MATRAQAQIACTHHDMCSFQEQTGNLERRLWMQNHGPCPQTFSLHVPLRFSFAAKGGLRNVSLDLPLLAEQLWLAGSARSCKTKNRGAERCRAVQSCPCLCSVDFWWFLAPQVTQVTQHMPLTWESGFPYFGTTLRRFPFNFQRFGTSLNSIRHIQTFCFNSSSPKWFNGAWRFIVNWVAIGLWHIEYFGVFCGSSWIIGWFAK